MNQKKLKRNVLVSTLFFGVVFANLFRTHALDNMRAVDALQLVATGALLGAIIVNVVMYMKFKNKE